MTNILRVRALPMAAAVAIAAVSSAPALACDADPLFGSVCMTAASYCPPGYIEANGAVLPIQSYQPLFALFGHSFDVNNPSPGSSFQIPDLRARTPVAAGTTPGLTPVPLAQRRGINATALSLAQMPVHTHTGTVTASAAGMAVATTLPVSANITGNTATASATNGYMATLANGGNTWSPTLTAPIPVAGASATVGGGYSGGTVANAATGGVANVAQPFTSEGAGVGIRFCVAWDGYWPNRP